VIAQNVNEEQSTADNSNTRKFFYTTYFVEQVSSRVKAWMGAENLAPTDLVSNL
jgi:predicted  nucleic acid-binding Zn ribbon protein